MAIVTISVMYASFQQDIRLPAIKISSILVLMHSNRTYLLLTPNSTSSDHFLYVSVKNMILEVIDLVYSVASLSNHLILRCMSLSF